MSSWAWHGRNGQGEGELVGGSEYATLWCCSGAAVLQSDCSAQRQASAAPAVAVHSCSSGQRCCSVIAARQRHSGAVAAVSAAAAALSSCAAVLQRPLRQAVPQWLHATYGHAPATRGPAFRSDSSPLAAVTGCCRWLLLLLMRPSPSAEARVKAALSGSRLAACHWRTRRRGKPPALALIYGICRLLFHLKV